MTVHAMPQPPPTSTRSRGLFFVLAIGGLILGMGWFFAADVLHTRSQKKSAPGELPPVGRTNEAKASPEP